MKQKIITIISILLLPVYFAVGMMLSLIGIIPGPRGIWGEIYDVLCNISLYAVLLAGVIGVVAGILLRRKGRVKWGNIVSFSGVWVVLVIALLHLLLGAAEMAQEYRAAHISDERLYGKGLTAEPAVDGVPEEYQVLLNKYYVILEEEWDEDTIRAYGDYCYSRALPVYYEGGALENLGFSVLDLNGDGSEELLIGLMPGRGQPEKLILDIYYAGSEEANGFSTVEWNRHFIHDAGDGTYYVEQERDNLADNEENAYRLAPDGTEEWVSGLHLNAEDRLQLELISFAEYH